MSLYHPPIGHYVGLTIILSEPSRIDTLKLLSGYAGQYFENCFKPYSRANFDIRISSDNRPLLPGTKVVFLLGGRALASVSPDKEFNNYCGTPFINNGIIYLASYPPQDTYDRKNYFDIVDDENEVDAEIVTEKEYQKTRRVNWRFWLYQDISKCKRLLRNGCLNQYPIPTYAIAPVADLVIELLTKTKHKYAIIDIETYPNKSLACIGICFIETPFLFPSNNITIFSIPFINYNNTLHYSELESVKILRAINIAFRDNIIIGHNLNFDLMILAWKYGVIFPLDIRDTMVMQQRCFPETEKSLGHTIRLHTDLPYHKDEGIFTPCNYNQYLKLLAYNAKDVFGTTIVFGELTKYANKIGATESCEQANKSLRPYLTKMMLGLKINIDAFTQLFDSLVKRTAQCERILRLLVGNELNPRSPKQVSNYIYEVLGYEKPFKDPTKLENLLKLYIKHGTPSLRVIIDTRKYGKLASFLKFRLWGKEQDRLTCNLSVAGTATFRASSKAMFRFKGDKGYGTNDQNWSKKIRHVVVADSNKILIQIDQAGAEALIVAYLAGHGALRTLFDLGIKPHVFVALHLVPEYWAKCLMANNIDNYLNSSIDNLRNIERWKELENLIKASDDSPDPRKRYYYIGKQCCHAFNYDEQPGMFQLQTFVKSEGTLRLTLNECEKFYNLYHSLMPEIRSVFHVNIQNELKVNKRVLRNLFGFPRSFNGFWGNDLFKKAYAFKPQSTVGCITHIAATEIQEEIEKRNPIYKSVDILQNGHDSLLFQAPDDKELLKELIPKLQSHFNRKLLSPKGEVFFMKSGASVGHNWGVRNKKNPEGLIDYEKFQSFNSL